MDNNLSTVESPVLLSKYRYGYDDVGRRTYNERTGPAFAGSYYHAFDYNHRSEMTAADYYSGSYGSGTADPNQDAAWSYDNIGNRSTATADGSGENCIVMGEA